MRLRDRRLNLGPRPVPSLLEDKYFDTNFIDDGIVPPNHTGNDEEIWNGVWHPSVISSFKVSDGIGCVVFERQQWAKHDEQLSWPVPNDLKWPVFIYNISLR